MGWNPFDVEDLDRATRTALQAGRVVTKMLVIDRVILKRLNQVA